MNLHTLWADEKENMYPNPQKLNVKSTPFILNNHEVEILQMEVGFRN